MKILIATVGSTGDVQPFVALGLELAKHHQVTMMTYENVQQHVSRAGLAHLPHGKDPPVAEVDTFMEGLLALRDPIQQAKSVLEMILSDVEISFARTREGLADADLLVTHHIDLAAQEAAIQMGKPWVSVFLAPLFASAHHPPIGLPDLGPFLNRFTWKFATLTLQSVHRMVRQRLALVGSRRHDLMAGQAFSPLLNLYAADSEVGPIYDDMPGDMQATGAWFVPEDREPSAEIRAFLEGGEPPVALALGSMWAPGDGDTGNFLEELARQLPGRTLIQFGHHEGAPRLMNGGKDLLIGFCPHEYLFPRVSCVVHHGGAGTTQAACRNGKPSVVVPHIVDQFYWGKQLQKLGVAPAMIHRHRATPERLAGAIREVLSRPDYSRAARELAFAIRSHSPTEYAVKLIEDAVR